MEMTREEFNKAIGDRLKNLRKAKGFKKPADLAEKVGMVPDSYRRIESGKVALSPALAWKIADELDCSIDYLLGREDATEKLTITDLEPMEMRIIKQFRKMDAEEKLNALNKFDYFIVSLEEGGSTEE